MHTFQFLENFDFFSSIPGVDNIKKLAVFFIPNFICFTPAYCGLEYLYSSHCRLYAMCLVAQWSGVVVKVRVLGVV